MLYFHIHEVLKADFPDVRKAVCVWCSKTSSHFFLIKRDVLSVLCSDEMTTDVSGFPGFCLSVWKLKSAISF